MLVRSYGGELWYWPFLLSGGLLVTTVVVSMPFVLARLGKLPVRSIHVQVAAFAIALVTWLPGLSAKGTHGGFRVAPGFLRDASQDVQDLNRRIRDRLAEENAHRILVHPSLYYAFVKDRDPTGLDAWSWSPVSEPPATPFDHLIITANHAEELADIDLPIRLLADHVCVGMSEVRSDDGYFFARIMTLAYRPSAGQPYVPCPSPGA